MKKLRLKQIITNLKKVHKKVENPGLKVKLIKLVSLSLHCVSFHFKCGEKKEEMEEGEI